MKVLVLGCGAVGTVSALKFAQEAACTQLVVADAVPGRAQELADRIGRPQVRALTVDARDRSAVAEAICQTRTTILLNAALPATNLIVMRACLDAGCEYIDMASGGAENDGIPKLTDQFALSAEFEATHHDFVRIEAPILKGFQDGVGGVVTEVEVDQFVGYGLVHQLALLLGLVDDILGAG